PCQQERAPKRPFFRCCGGSGNSAPFFHCPSARPFCFARSATVFCDSAKFACMSLPHCINAADCIERCLATMSSTRCLRRFPSFSRERGQVGSVQPDPVLITSGHILSACSRHFPKNWSMLLSFQTSK